MHNNESYIKGVYIVPGLPHLLQKTSLNKGYQQHFDAMTSIKKQLTERGVKRIVYYSSQWLSVLGVSVQSREHLQDVHVDENWYDYGNLPFHFKSCQKFATGFYDLASKAGYAVAKTDYQGFPIDTGSIVAQSILNPKAELFTSNISSHVYADYDSSEKMGAIVRQVIENDKIPTAIVAVTGLTMNYFTRDIDLREDHIRDDRDDQWNKKLLAILEDGKFLELKNHIQNQSQGLKLDMGLKAVGWALGAAGLSSGAVKRGKTLAYAPIYGTGAATIEIE